MQEKVVIAKAVCKGCGKDVEFIIPIQREMVVGRKVRCKGCGFSFETHYQIVTKDDFPGGVIPEDTQTWDGEMKKKNGVLL